MPSVIPTIETARLLLRDFLTSDVSAIFATLSHPKVTEFYDSHPLEELADAEQWLQHNKDANHFANKKGARWAIADKLKPQCYLGSCSVHSLSKNYKSLHIGYELHPTYWGQGFAYEATSALINYCFTHNYPIAIERIAATTALVNPKSIALLQRLGFIETAILRNHGFWKEAYHDVRVFSLTRERWQATKATAE